MKAYINTTIKTKELSSITCDKCGFDILGDDFERYEYFHIHHSCGYGSIFGDGNEINIDLCQVCFKKMIGNIINNQEGNVND